MERPLTPTPLSASAVATAFVPGYVNAFARAPDRNSAELLTALVYLENAHGSAINNFNWGNISTQATDSVNYWRPPWFDLDAINARPDTDPKKQHLLDLHAAMVAGKEPQAFRAFDSHSQGIVAWLNALPQSMLDAAATGDPFAFAKAYYSSGYCPDEACRTSGPAFLRLQKEIQSAHYFDKLLPTPAAVSAVTAAFTGGSSGMLLAAGLVGAATLLLYLAKKRGKR